MQTIASDVDVVVSHCDDDYGTCDDDENCEGFEFFRGAGESEGAREEI